MKPCTMRANRLFTRAFGLLASAGSLATTESLQVEESRGLPTCMAHRPDQHACDVECVGKLFDVDF